MRKAELYYKDNLAAYLTDTDDGEYLFQYTTDDVEHHPNQFLAFSMPVSKKPYKDKRLFSFFEGLIPEGWLLDIATKNWKLNLNRFTPFIDNWITTRYYLKSKFPYQSEILS
jgi:serine/threonine-protein kinase HipA